MEENSTNKSILVKKIINVAVFLSDYYFETEKVQMRHFL